LRRIKKQSRNGSALARVLEWRDKTNSICPEVKGRCGTGTASARKCRDGFMDALFSVQESIRGNLAVKGRCGTGIGGNASERNHLGGRLRDEALSADEGSVQADHACV